MKPTEIKDINGKTIQDGDLVENRNLTHQDTYCIGRMSWEKDWWFFIGDDGCRVGVPPYIADSKIFGVMKLED